MIFCISLILCLACSKSKTESDFMPITFNVVDSLLADDYHDLELGIRLNPPLNCLPVETELLDSLQTKIEASDSLTIKFKQIFMNLETGFSCILSTFESDQSTEEIMKIYHQDFISQHDNLILDESLFSHNGLNFQQYILRRENFISIVLLTQNNQQAFVINYMIPMAFYEDLVAAIESSIGTINKTEEDKT